MADPSPPAAPPAGFRFKGAVAGREQTFPLVAGHNTVGSAAGNRVQLEQAGVSRVHAVVTVEPERIVIGDDGSKNGTFVNGRPVSRAELVAGDRVAFGPVELVLEPLHPDDAELGVELQAVSASRTPGSTSETTAAYQPPLDDEARHWLKLVRAFVAQLPHGAAAALAQIGQGLAVLGACLVELADDASPQVTAAWGEVAQEHLDRLSHVDRMAGAWRRLPASATAGGVADGLFVHRSDLAAFLLPASPRPLGVVVAGSFAGSGDSAPFLATLLEVYANFRHAAPAAAPPLDAVRPGAARELSLPPEYVPGVSAAMQALYAQMRPLLQGDLPVLIAGETGVGKEWLASILHRSSSRRDGPFVAINCAAIPAELLEAELFGIGDRVATGVAGRRGHFQRAEGGTLFLDEIAEMPRDLQAKLLRVLQEKRLHPVGSPPIAIDVRIVAATNADIFAEMDVGRFRRDLFFRIAGFVLEVPPLRERREDVPLLVERFLQRFSAEVGKPVRGMTMRALRALQAYRWPGNVRELEHEVRRLVYLCPPGQAIEHAMLSPHTLADADPLPPPPAADGDTAEHPRPELAPLLDLAALERQAVEEALRRSGGNQVQAARALGITRSSLRRRLQRYGLAAGGE